MDTPESKKRLLRFIILIPHRDALGPFEEYRKKLFSIGYCGAYSFPSAAPLAAVSRPFSREELKDLGRNIRNFTKESDGKIMSAECAFVQYPRDGKPHFLFFGPALSLQIKEDTFTETVRAKILHAFYEPVLCAALTDSAENPVSKENQIAKEAPALSFRAASVANLAIRPLDCGANRATNSTAANYSLEWKIGPPVWLPKYKGK